MLDSLIVVYRRHIRRLNSSVKHEPVRDEPELELELARTVEGKAWTVRSIGLGSSFGSSL